MDITCYDEYTKKTQNKDETVMVHVGRHDHGLPSFSEFPKLRAVNFISRFCTSLECLKGCNIEELTVSYGCSDIETLSTMVNLKMLNIDTITPECLKCLHRLIALYLANIYSTELFYNLPPNLRLLSVNRMIVEKVDLRRKINHVRTLYIGSATSLEFIQLFPKLNRLGLYVNYDCSELKYVSSCCSLKHLTLKMDPYPDNIFFLPLTLPNLVSLDLGRIQIADLDFLDNSPFLTSLSMSNCKVVSCRFDPIWRLKRLSKLKLDDCNIEELEGIEAISDTLSTLQLHKCKVKDIRPISSMTALETLDLYGSPVVDISPIGSVPTLKYLVPPKTILNGLHCMFRMKSVGFPDGSFCLNIYTPNGELEDIESFLENRKVTGDELAIHMSTMNYVDESVGQFIKKAL